MDYNSAIALLERWAAGERNLPAEEHAELVRWMLTAPEAEREALLELAMERALEWPAADNADAGLVARIEAALDAESVEETPVRPLFEQPFKQRTGPRIDRRIGRRLARFTAAAVLIGLVGWWWLEHRGRSDSNNSQPVATRRMDHDVAPGKNAAVLTLAGGKMILLDSAANGLLAQQNGIKIQKSSDGRLAYIGGVGGEAPHSPNARTPQADAHLIYNTLSTPRGGQYQLTLSDGTKVWLNAESSVTYPTAFTGKERTVEISGEAYFEVAHRADQPFRVKAGDEVIEDLGTAFDVNAYSDEPVIATSLVSGSINIHTGKRNVTMSPGEQAREDRNDALQLDTKADIEKIVAWKTGKFIFDRDELPVILRQLSRWYDVGIQYQGQPPAGHFSGVISRNRNLSQVLDLLKATNNIHFTIENKTIVILP